MRPACGVGRREAQLWLIDEPRTRKRSGSRALKKKALQDTSSTCSDAGIDDVLDRQRPEPRVVNDQGRRVTGIRVRETGPGRVIGLRRRRDTIDIRRVADEASRAGRVYPGESDPGGTVEFLQGSRTISRARGRASARVRGGRGRRGSRPSPERIWPQRRPAGSRGSAAGDRRAAARADSGRVTEFQRVSGRVGDSAQRLRRRARRAVGDDHEPNEAEQEQLDATRRLESGSAHTAGRNPGRRGTSLVTQRGSDR